MRLLRVVIAVVLAAPAPGCSKSPDHVAKQAREAAGSWGATLSVAAAMKQIGKNALGVVTIIAGFVDVGTIATAALAGAVYGVPLLWIIALATICAIFLTEMAGRLGAVSHHTIADALRERLGFNY